MLLPALVAHLAAASATAWAGGCELFLGSLPPVHAQVDGGGGSGGTGGTTVGSAAQGTGGCCDCDGDHAAAAGLCGGADCDDHDARAYPGEPVYYATASPNAAVGFDWDCSGKADPNPALDAVVSCAGLALPCMTKTGFLAATPPPCGVGAPWGTCKQAPSPGLTCVEDVIEPNKVMTCK